MDFKVYYAALHSLFNLSHSKLRAIYAACGKDIEVEWNHFEKNRLLNIIKPKSYEQAINEWREWDMDAFANALAQLRVHIVCEFEEYFPAICREVSPVPFVLYLRGNVELLRLPSVALVGSRKMSFYGGQLVTATVPLLVQAGFVTVSGGAFGIDTAVHRSTMEAEGKTIAVLGTGVDTAYPASNAGLYKQMVERGHLLVSEFPVHRGPEPFHFPLRNRIIAALGGSVLVIEARESSGALITARAALEIGKDVFCFVGNIFDKAMEGTYALIYKGEAAAIVSPTHLLEQLGCLVESSLSEHVTKQVSEEEKIFLELFSGVPAEQDSIFERSTMSISEFQLQMTLMEVKGFIQKVEGTKWVRSCSFSFTTDK